MRLCSVTTHQKCFRRPPLSTRLDTVPGPSSKAPSKWAIRSGIVTCVAEELHLPLSPLPGGQDATSHLFPFKERINSFQPPGLPPLAELTNRARNILY